MTDEVVKALSSFRFRWSSERELQDGIEQVLTLAGLPFTREVVLSNRDRIDFMVGGCGVEVKTKGSVNPVLAQLQRYAEHESVESLVLVTGRRQLVRMPSSLNGKRVAVISLLGGLC